MFEFETIKNPQVVQIVAYNPQGRKSLTKERQFTGLVQYIYFEKLKDNIDISWPEFSDDRPKTGLKRAHDSCLFTFQKQLSR